MKDFFIVPNMSALQSMECIRRNANKYVRNPDSDDSKLYKKLLLDCPHELTKRGTEEI